MTVEKDPAAGAWHVDRRVSIALIVTILIQTGAAIWWASSVNSFMGDTQKAAGALEVRVTKVEGTTQDVNLRLVRLEVLLENQTALLTEIRDKMAGGR